MRNRSVIIGLNLIFLSHGIAVGQSASVSDKMLEINQSVRNQLDREYIPLYTGSKVEFGPIWETISSNTQEGFRLQAAARTTSYFSENVRLAAKIAYGFRDYRVKYGGEMTVRVRPDGEVLLKYDYDTDFIGQYLPFGMSHHSLKQSFMRRTNRWIDYRRSARAGYRYQASSGLTWTGSLVHDRYKSGRYTPYVSMHDSVALSVSSTYFLAQVEYTPDMNTRRSTWFAYPHFSIAQSMGPSGMPGATFANVATLIEVAARFRIADLGSLSATLRGAATWTHTPYPAMTLPSANLSRRYVYSTFMLMQPMELTADRHLSLFMSYSPEGRLLGLVPMFRDLGLCSFITMNTAIGHLSSNNRPINDEGLPAYPIYTSTFDGLKPYMELSIGIGSLKHRIRIDYVWRLTYRKTPEADMSGLRVGVDIH